MATEATNNVRAWRSYVRVFVVAAVLISVAGYIDFSYHRLTEIDEKLRSRVWWILLFGLMQLCAAGLGVYLWWFRQRAKDLLKLYETEQRHGRELAEAARQMEELNLTLEAKVEERTQELLRERNNLKGILDAMNDGVYIVNQQYGIEYANPAMVLEFGPIEGFKCYEYRHGSQAVCSWCRNQEVFSEISVHRECTSKINGKTYSTFDTPYKNATGEIYKLTIFHDVTDRKKIETDLRQQLRFTQKLLDSIPSPVYFKDTEGRYLGCNKAYEKFRGISQKKLLGKQVFDIAQPDDAEALHIIDIKLLDTSDSLQYETSIITGDGSRRDVIYHKARFDSITGEPVGMIGVIQDITVQKRAEKAVKDQNEELELRVVERTRSLRDANEELRAANEELELKRREAEIIHEEQRQTAEELMTARDAAHAASRSKSEFLANMSHEIRTPLNAIIGFSSLILKSSLSPSQHNYTRNIHTAGELLLTTINDILDFSKIEAGQLDMEQTLFRLDRAIPNLVSVVQQKALDKGLQLDVTISPEIPTVLKGDPHRLSQIIVNLLSNAIKFTEKGEIRLEAHLLTREADYAQLEFSVSDTGIGISGENISKLFQPFTQADGSTTRQFGGTGLGLSISKQLVEMMGGEIWCESVPGNGSTFRFSAWFGVGKPEDMVAGSYSDSGREGKAFHNFSGSTILLVEDNDMNRQLAIELLKGTGALVKLASNGKEAVSLITCGDTTYDLVLMDIQMPVMDGYEATRIIRSDSNFDSLPIIAMTAHAMLEEQQKIMQLGMNAYISKPIDAQLMLQVIGTHLGGQKRGDPGEIVEAIADDISINGIANLDVSGALYRLDGNRELYLWLLGAFVESQSSAADVIREALDLADMKAALRYSHTIKGNAGSIGALELQELALTLEGAISRGEAPEKIGSALGCLSIELERLTRDLRLFLEARK